MNVFLQDKLQIIDKKEKVKQKKNRCFCQRDNVGLSFMLKE